MSRIKTNQKERKLIVHNALTFLYTEQANATTAEYIAMVEKIYRTQYADDLKIIAKLPDDFTERYLATVRGWRNIGRVIPLTPADNGRERWETLLMASFTLMCHGGTPTSEALARWRLDKPVPVPTPPRTYTRFSPEDFLQVPESLHDEVRAFNEKIKETLADEQQTVNLIEQCLEANPSLKLLRKNWPDGEQFYAFLDPHAVKPVTENLPIPAPDLAPLNELIARMKKSAETQDESDTETHPARKTRSRASKRTKA